VPGVLIDLHYLPSVAYFSTLRNASGIVIEKHEHYEKQTYRNRCYINTANGIVILIVPTIATHKKMQLCDIQIDYRQKWLNNHWRSIQSGYGKAPFFEYYAEDLQRILFRKFQFLYDLNLELLTLCLKMLKMNLTIVETVAYDENVTNDLIDLRSAINPKKTNTLNLFYKPAPNYQVFGNKFVQNLSILDVLFL
jgi:hypothetical protein